MHNLMHVGLPGHTILIHLMPTRYACFADRLNQRFVHLSESCIPLYPPALIYMQLLHEQKSRVQVDDPKQ